MRISTEIMSRPASKQYRDNFDHVFGKKKPVKCLGKCSCGDPCVVGPGGNHLHKCAWLRQIQVGLITSRK